MTSAADMIEKRPAPAPTSQHVDDVVAEKEQGTILWDEETVRQERHLVRCVADNATPTWQPLNPFDKVLDLFGDGSLYIVDSPGHLIGHLNILVRVREDHWVYLAGDACHHPRLLSGEAEMAEWEENGARVCIHANKQVAEETLRKIQRARSEGIGGATVEVVLAHDAEWFDVHKDCVFPASLSCA